MKLIEIALTQYGVTEVKGAEDNPEVLKYFTDCGFLGSHIKDETAWCSAFMNWVCQKAGIERSGKLNARSWLDLMTGVKTPYGDRGDIVVFWRESRDSWKGHVGICVNQDDQNIWVLGGNQNNSVCVKPYPKSRLLSFVKMPLL